MKKILLTLTIISYCFTAIAQQLPMKLWYDKPAQFFEESLPIWKS